MVAIAVSVFLISLVAEMQVVKVAEANFVPSPPGTPYGFIYINVDGSVTPTNLPITSSDNVYKLTENITNYGVKVERDGIIIDGAGYSLQVTEWYAPSSQYLKYNCGIAFADFKHLPNSIANT